MRTTTYRYHPVKAYAKKSGRCPVCNKPVTRQRVFENTVNPFNKNPDGTVRTYQEVREVVNQLARDWEPDFAHIKCREPGESDV